MKQPTETPEIKTPVQDEAGQAGPSTPKRPLNTPPPKQAQREPHAKPAESETPSHDSKTLLSALKESEERLRALVEH